MEKLIIPHKGITTTAQPEPGDSYNLVNLRIKNGVLQPVAPRKTVKQLNSMYHKIFLHRLPSGQENMIGVRNASIYFDIDNTPELITDSLPGPVFSIQQIGNTISLMCEDAIHYLLWKGTSYVNLGILPEIPVIEIYTVSKPEIRGYYEDEYGLTSTTENLKQRIIAYISKEIAEANDIDTTFWDSLYIRWAFRLYDGTYIKHSCPVLISPEWSAVNLKKLDITKTAGSIDLPGLELVLQHYKIQLKADFGAIDDWADIIKSVDVFMSPELGLSSVQETTIDEDLEAIKAGTGGTYFVNKYISDLQRERIISESKFYHVYSYQNDGSIPSSSINFEFPYTDQDKFKVRNLPFQDNLEDDPALSHHTTGAKNSYVYNNRLHIHNIKTSLYQGFPLGAMLVRGVKYNGIDGLNVQYITDLAVKVYFDDPGISPVLRVDSSFVGVPLSGSYVASLSSLISYPDVRAVKMDIFFRKLDGGTYKWYYSQTFNLKPHSTLNLAYYYNGTSPIIFTTGTLITAPEELTSSVYQNNTLKVSDVNNPFRLSRTYSFDSEILNIASNTIKSSDFGQFPLYVFTKNRIFAMQIGLGDIAYSNSVIISNDQPISDKILPTPYGVFYITKRGLKSVGNSEVVTKSNEEARRSLSLSSIDIAGDPFLIQLNEELRDVLTDPDLLMLFNPNEDEVIFQGSLGAFVLGSGQIYRINDKFDGVVENAYPDVQLIRYMPKAGDVVPYMGYENVKISYILKEGDDGYEIGKIKGYVFLPFDYQLLDSHNAHYPDEDFYYPTVKNISLIVEGGLSGALQGPGSEIWLAEDDDYTGEGMPVFSTDDNTISYLYPYESELRSILLVKLIDIPTPFANTFIYDLAQAEGKARVSLTTRPINFGTSLYKRLERAVFRCQLISATNVYGMIHGSIDDKYFKALKGIKYNRAEGVTKPLNYKDLDLGMTTNKFKSYVFSLAATVEEDSIIEYIEAEVQQEYDNDKIR